MKPSIGRIVWFYPPSGLAADGVSPQARPEHFQPHAAKIAYVHGDNLVNLGVVDNNGQPYGETSVPLFEPDQVPYDLRATGRYATWMPYQVAQAQPAVSYGEQVQASSLPVAGA